MTSSVTLSRNNRHNNCKTTTNSTTNINNNNNNSYCVANYCPQNHYINSNEIAITTLNCSDIGIDVNHYGNNVSINPNNQSIHSIKANQHILSSNCVPSMSLSSISTPNPTVITIPFGWKRELVEGRVVYYSPTNCLLSSVDEIANYLEREGTCKCGLECPLIITKAFNFDASIPSKPYSIEEAKSNNENQLCNHKRKIIALATYKESQTAALIAEQQQIRFQHKLHQKHTLSDNSFYENDYNNFSVQQHFQNGDNVCTSQPNECLTLSSVGNQNPNSSQITVTKYSRDHHIVDAVSVIHANQSIDKLTSGVTETAIHCSSPHNRSHLVSHNINQYHNHSEHPQQQQQQQQQQQYIQTASNCDNRSHYSVPISSHSANALHIRSTGGEHIAHPANSFCLYDNSGNPGVYSFSSCDSTQLSVQQNDNKTSIYLTPQNTTNYGQMISYENGNVNLIQGSHSQGFTSDGYSHHYNHSDSGCNASNVQTTITGIQSYIPLHSGSHSLSSPNSANSGAISFNASPLSSTAINLNATYPSSGLHASHDHSQHHSQNNISILPQNPPMPPLSVPNVTTVTTSVTDVIPAVGVTPQMINSGNPSGAPQVLQIINSVPLTQISANTVTVLQQTPTQECSVPLLIPQLMPSHEHSMVINHAMAQQTAAMFPHIATATSLTALPNHFQNAIGIANAISLPQRNCIPETGKQFTRARKRKEYNRTNRSHPPTVASILKQAADNEKKQKELINQEKQQLLQQQLKTANSQTDENECTVDSSQKESISVAVQSELQTDCENLVNNVCSSSDSQILQSDNEFHKSLTGDNNENIPVLQDIQIESNNDENPISDLSSEHSSPSSECFNGTGSDSGVESEPTGTLSCSNCEEPDSQQVIDSTRQRSLKRLKRLRKELSVYCGNDNSDDESPQSPPLPPQPRTFNVGDLVWGQMGDVRFWPGKLVGDEELEGLSLKREDGKLLVKWFGGHTLTQVEPENLKTLTEGLEEHHCARKRHRSGKRMNSFLEQAIQEAMLELDRQTNDISLSSSSSAVLGVVTSTQTID